MLFKRHVLTDLAISPTNPIPTPPLKKNKKLVFYWRPLKDTWIKVLCSVWVHKERFVWIWRFGTRGFACNIFSVTVFFCLFFRVLVALFYRRKTDGFISTVGSKRECCYLKNTDERIPGYFLICVANETTKKNWCETHCSVSVIWILGNSFPISPYTWTTIGRNS